MNFSNRTKICAIAMTAVSAIILIGFFLNYIVIDFEEITKDLAIAQKTIIAALLNFFSGDRDSVTVSGLIILKTLFKNNSGSAEAVRTFSVLCAVTVAAPYFFAVTAFILSFFRQRWSFIVTAVMACAGEAVTVLGIYWFLPEMSSAHVFSLNGIKYISVPVLRSILLSGTGPAFWICAAGFPLLMAIALFGALTAGNRDRVPAEGNIREEWEPPRTPSFPEEPAMPAEKPDGGLLFTFGEYEGASIPLANGEVLCIGRSPEKCQVVLTQPEILPLHCAVRWNDGLKCYEIRGADRAALSVSGKPFRGETRAFSGEILALAGDQYIIRLL